jgi:hypothetical protein
VGGQAVGIWVSVFAAGRERSPYDAFRPMVSADMDVWGDLGTLRYLGRITGWSVETSRQRLQVQNLETGRLVGTAPDGPLVVRVLHAVHGLTRKELESSRTVTIGSGVVRWQESGGRTDTRRVAHDKAVRSHHSKLISGASITPFPSAISGGTIGSDEGFPMNVGKTLA